MQKRDSESDDGCGNDDDLYLASHRRHRRSSGNIPSPTPSDSSSDDGFGLPSTSRRKKPVSQDSPSMAAFPSSVRAFLDLSFWKKEEVCCGIIFRGPRGQVLVDPQLLKPCIGCQLKKQPRFTKSESAGEESESTMSTASSPTSKTPTEDIDFEQHIPIMMKDEEMATDRPVDLLDKNTVSLLPPQQLSY